jgi:hypothetical protein
MFRNEDMESVRGLGNLERAGRLVLSNALLMDDLTGLEGLTQVDDELSIIGNSGLHSLAGLDNLRTAGELTIVGNNELESLNGLSSLERVDGDVTIRATDKLQRTEIEVFLQGVDVGGTVTIRE